MTISAPFQVHCPSCASAFPVDPARVPEGGVAAICSHCMRVFHVQLPEPTDVWASQDEPGVPTYAPPASSGAPPVEADAVEAAMEEGRFEDAYGEEEFGPDEAIDVEPDEVSPVGDETAEADPTVEAEEIRVGEAEEEPVEEPQDKYAEEPQDEYAEEPRDEHAEEPQERFVEEPEDEGVVEPEVEQVERPEPRSVSFTLPQRERPADVDSEAGRAVTEAEPASEKPTGVREAEDGPSAAAAAGEDAVMEEAAAGEDALMEEAAADDGAFDVDLGVPEAPATEEPRWEPQLESDTASPPEAAPAGGAPRFGRRDPHERARTLARVLVSDMITYHPARFEEGRERGNLREVFADEVEKSWAEYVEQVGEELAASTTYFVEALNEILGGGERLYQGSGRPR